jgi:glutamate 5-kinase
LILTSVDGIYEDPDDPDTLIPIITENTVEELLRRIDSYCAASCKGASRKGAKGASAKLAYIKEPLKIGATVIIASSHYSIDDILRGLTPQTRIGLRVEEAC